MNTKTTLAVQETTAKRVRALTRQLSYEENEKISADVVIARALDALVATKASV